MPTYEYACKSCGQHLEAVQSFTDDALTTCPTCGGTLRKVFGNIGISFKGTGFYKNDSRSSTRSGSPGAGSDGPSKSDSAAASTDGGSSSSDSPSPKESSPSSSPKESSTTKESTSPTPSRDGGGRGASQASTAAAS